MSPASVGIVVGAGGGAVVVVVGAGAGAADDEPVEVLATPPGPKSLISALYEFGFSEEVSAEDWKSK